MTDRETDKRSKETSVARPLRQRLGRDVQSTIGQQLRAMYDDVVTVGSPDRFSELLRQLDESGQGTHNLQSIGEAARETFGDDEFARKWLTLPNPALDNRVPIEVAATDSGDREVRAILSRIAYGDYS